MQRRFRLFDFDPDSVAMVSMSTVDDSLFIVKNFTTGDWYSTSPIPVKIYDERIKNLFNKVINIERFQRPLTNNPRTYTFYRVSPNTGTRVIIFDKNENVLDDLFFGMADLYSYGAVRRTDELVVYEIASEIRHDVSPILSHWRDPFMIRFSRDTADSVHVKYTVAEYMLSRSEHAWFFTNDEEHFHLTNAHLSFSGIMRQLENMTSHVFIDNQWEVYEELFQNPVLELTIYHSNGSVDSVSYIVTSEDECIILVNDNTDVLYMGLLIHIDRFTRSATRFQTDLFIYTH
jgi:hypothetical protein